MKNFANFWLQHFPMHRYKHIIYLLAGVILILAGCANPIPLEGGPKDETAPVLVRSLPDTFSVNFRSRKIKLEFDEYILLRNANQELVVSPPMELSPEIKLLYKTVEITFTDSLLPNTTYSLNFGKGIVDNNENNPATNFTYVFSTGPVIDSGKVSALLLDAYTLKPLAGARFMIYREFDDSVPRTARPYNAAVSDNSGNVAIPYLAQGDYHAFALVDVNMNMKYDLPSENIGFLDSMLSTTDSNVVRILVFNEGLPAQKLATAKNDMLGRIFFLLNGIGDSAKFTILTDSFPPVQTHSEWGNDRHDSLVYWFTPPQETDSLAVSISFPGQTDTIITIRLRKTFTPSGGDRKKKAGGTAPSTGFSISAPSATAHDHTLPLPVEFSIPVATWDTSRIQMLQDSIRIPFQLEKADSLGKKFRLVADWKPESNYRFTIADSALQTVTGIYNDTLKLNILTARLKDFTNMIFRVEGFPADISPVFELLDKDDLVIRSQSGTRNGDTIVVTFNRILPSNYRVRLIYDANSNGKWDTGSFAERRQPEKTSYFPATIDPKSGFDSEFNWDLNATGKKAKVGGK